MKITEVFDCDLPGQCRICSHKIVLHVMLCVCSVNTVCTAMLLIIVIIVTVISIILTKPIRAQFAVC